VLVYPTDRAAYSRLCRLLSVGKKRGGNPVTKKKDVVWFALNEDRPLFAFAGIWTEYKGDRGTKSKPIPGPHCVYGFLTTSPSSNRYTPKRCW
jgi:hypothetical protein